MMNRFAFFSLNAFVFAFLCGLYGCKEEVFEENLIGSPPFYGYYAINLFFVDRQGGDASDRLPLELIGTEGEESVYGLSSGEFSLTCLVDGVELPDSCLTGFYDDDWKPVYSRTVTDVKIVQMAGEPLKMFTLKWENPYFISPQEFMSENLRVFDYRFRCPLLFGDRENNIQIVSRATFFNNGRYEKASFNGKPIEHQYSIFKIVVDDK